MITPLKLYIHGNGSDDVGWRRSGRVPKTVFVRLSKATAHRLSRTQQDYTDLAMATNKSSDIQFLPLRIRLPNLPLSSSTASHHPSSETSDDKPSWTNSDGFEIFASFNGGTIDEDEVISLPSTLLPEQWYRQYLREWVESNQSGNAGIISVDVDVALGIRVATSVELEPLSTEDWELLQVHAESLEDGGVLQQVSVLYLHQVLPLHVFSNGQRASIARIRVVSICFDDTDHDGEQGFNVDAARLMDETELSIAPKPRPAPPKWSRPLRIVPEWDDWCEEMKVLAVKTIPASPLSERQYKPERNTVWIHNIGEEANPSTCDNEIDSLLYHNKMMELVPSSSSATSNTKDSETIVVQVVASVHVPPNHIVLHREVRLRLGLVPFSDHVRIKLLQPQPTHLRPKDETAKWREAMYHDTAGTQVVSEIMIPTIASRRYECSIELSNEQTDEKTRKVYEGRLQLLPATATAMTSSCSELFASIMDNVHCYDLIGLTGSKGCGKTHTSLVIAAMARMQLGYGTVYLDCHRLQSMYTMSKVRIILEHILGAFHTANEMSPSLIILDELDSLIPTLPLGNGTNNGSTSSSKHDIGKLHHPAAIKQAKMISDVLRGILQECREHDIRVLVTMKIDDDAEHPQELMAALSDSLTLSKVVTLPSSHNRQDRKLLLQSMAAVHGLSVDHEESWLVELAKRTDGYRPFDLDKISGRLQEAANLDEKSNGLLRFHDIEKILREYVPLARQGIADNSSRKVTQGMSQVGGLFQAKKQLEATVFRPIRYRRIYENLPTHLPRGILMYGYPGCGKTFLVPALASECNLTLITCRGPELLDRYIGASEAKVRQLFARAASAAPSLLFLDEFDALAPRRGTDTSGVTDRVVNQLLTFLDGVESSLSGVFVIAASSRPDRIDPALLRPGRLEKHVFVGYPETKEEWCDVMEKVSKSFHFDDGVLRDGTIMDELFLTAPEPFILSPADVKGALNTAYLDSIHDELDQATSKNPEEQHRVIEASTTIKIQRRHLENALSKVRPSLAPKDRLDLEARYERFRSGRGSGSATKGKTEDANLKTALR